MPQVLPDDDTITFLLCETARVEQAGKLSLLGLFPGGQILVPLSTTVVNLRGVSFMFIVTGGEGVFETKISVAAPSGAEIIPEFPLPNSEKHPNRPLTVGCDVAPFWTSEFGTFRVRLKLDNATYERSFSIEKGSPNPNFGTVFSSGDLQR